MYCTKGKIQSDMETFQMPNWQEVVYINLIFPSHTGSYMRAIGFCTVLQSPTHLNISSWTHSETSSSLYNRPCLQVLIFSPVQSRICKAGSVSQATTKSIRQKTYLESTLNHWILPNPQKLQPLSLTVVTRESCFALLIQWLSHKHPQKQKLLYLPGISLLGVCQWWWMISREM